MFKVLGISSAVIIGHIVGNHNQSVYEYTIIEHIFEGGYGIHSIGVVLSVFALIGLSCFYTLKTKLDAVKDEIEMAKNEFRMIKDKFLVSDSE